MRRPTDPPTFDEYLALRDPLAPVKMRVNLIIKALDNEIVGTHVNQMTPAVIDISGSPYGLLISDRPASRILQSPGGERNPIDPHRPDQAARRRQ
jgi:hypothetical protein